MFHAKCISGVAKGELHLQDGHYGEQRMFASLGWGIFSALSGYLAHKFSIYTAFQLFFALTAFAIIPVCFLKFHLKPHLAQVRNCLSLTIPHAASRLSASACSV